MMMNWIISFMFLIELMQCFSNIQRGIFEFQSVGCCDPVAVVIKFETEMEEIPQVLLTIRALEFESGPIGYFSSINDITPQGFTVQMSVPRGSLRLIVYEYVALNSDLVEFGFFNIDALGTLHTQTTGDATVPLFMRFKRYFVEEPLVQIFLVGFESESKAISFEIQPFSVAQNGVTLKINKYGPTTLTRLQVSYVATEQSTELARAVTHTGSKSANIGYEFLQMGQDNTNSTSSIDSTNQNDDQKTLELVQLAGINGLRFLQTPIAFIWQGDRVEPTALNVNLRITLDKGNQAVLGLYYFESKKFQRCPRLYSECNYQGVFLYVCKNIPDFERVFKQAKSVFIPNKSSLVVYQDTSYTGVRTKIIESNACLTDWFKDVPSETLSDIQTLLQLDGYRKHSMNNEALFIQKQQAHNTKDFWQNQKQSYGIRMPNWYEYNNDDGTLIKSDDKIDHGSQFQKVEYDKDSLIQVESVNNQKQYAPSTAQSEDEFDSLDLDMYDHTQNQFVHQDESAV